MKSKTKAPIGTALVVFGIIVDGMCWIAHQYGLWLPDIVLPKRTLARAETPDGHRFRVVQYAGDLEWYTTDLIHTFPSGEAETNQLAFEDEFAWRVPMSISASQRVITVQVGSGRYRRVAW